MTNITNPRWVTYRTAFDALSDEYDGLQRALGATDDPDEARWYTQRLERVSTALDAMGAIT